MRYTLLLLASLFVGLAPPTTRSTASLTGRVVATHTGTPLSDATVRVDGATREARTDSLGTFVLPGVPVGTVTVRARRIGFTPVPARCGWSVRRVSRSGSIPCSRV